MANSRVEIHVGELWHCGDDREFSAIPQGALAVLEGRIRSVGRANEVRRLYPDAIVVDHGDQIVLPGFIDNHVHSAQLDTVASYGSTLLGWLDKYAYPDEERLAKAEVARDIAQRFFRGLLSHGTTTSMVFATSHFAATETLFKEAEQAGVRSIIGKVSMDRSGPESLRHDVETDLSDNKRLISKWHGKNGLLHCALTPRFALSCSEELMTRLGELRREHPDIYVQTHLSENQDEIAAVRQLYPDDADYFSVYERFGLTGSRSVFAHAIHCSDAELDRIGADGCGIAHCPTSNLFLGSGLFPYEKFRQRQIPVSLATDVGGGTSLSMWRTMLAAYKIQKLQHNSLAPGHLLYLATLAGAECLGLAAEVGNFVVGKQADFQVVDGNRVPMLRDRFKRANSAEERLFAMITLGDERITESVYVAGKQVFSIV